MGRPLSLKLRNRPVPTPLELSPLPFSPDYSAVWAHKLSSDSTATPMMTAAQTGRTLTPFMLSAHSNVSSASAYSCDWYTSVEDWSEISQLSSQPVEVPDEYIVRGNAYDDIPVNWDELSQVLSHHRKDDENDTPLQASVAKTDVRKLRSRSITAMQLEGRRSLPIPPRDLQAPKLRANSIARLPSKRASNTLLPPIDTRLQDPIFTPSIFLSSPDGAPQADVNPNKNPPPFTPSLFISSPSDSNSSSAPPTRVSRWDRPKRSVSMRDRGGGHGRGLALPSLPGYVPIEGLDTKQDEQLKVRGLRHGVIFTVAQMIPDLTTPAIANTVPKAAMEKHLCPLCNKFMTSKKACLRCRKQDASATVTQKPVAKKARTEKDPFIVHAPEPSSTQRVEGKRKHVEDSTAQVRVKKAKKVKHNHTTVVTAADANASNYRPPIPTQAFQTAEMLFAALKQQRMPYMSFSGTYSIVADSEINHIKRTTIIAVVLRDLCRMKFDEKGGRGGPVLDGAVKQYPCTCASRCGGTILITSSNDNSHRLRIPGQKIVIEVKH
ncbi:hypothetical protein ONZ45_g9424 [Pleurotus djamor]|nr:hypothetical protein ONZ45_g9424 [Pleurotus djamor]